MVRNFFVYNRAKKAIREIQVFISELEGIDNTAEANIWKDKVLTAFFIYFGENSDMTKRLNNTYFTENHQQVIQGVIGILDNYVFTPAKKERFKAILNAAIQLIQNNGAKKDYVRSNFLRIFSDEVIIGIIIAIITGTFALTLLITDKKDKAVESELEYVKLKLKEKQDSLLIISKKSVQNVNGLMLKLDSLNNVIKSLKYR